jgi:hypothetical protein
MTRTVPPSFRRKPESRLSEYCLDPGVRRDDGAVQRAARRNTEGDQE